MDEIKYTVDKSIIWGGYIKVMDPDTAPRYNRISVHPSEPPIFFRKSFRPHNQTTYRQEHEPASYYCHGNKRKYLLLHYIFHREISERETDAGRLFSPFCMARSVHKFFTK